MSKASLTSETQLRFFNAYPKFSAGQTTNCVLLYDRKLAKVCPSLIESFPLRIAVRAGESLKTFPSVDKTLRKILNLTSGLGSAEIFLVSLGGGSVGDFTGFCASILKRGTQLISIPSTWLSAIDSAHGGKTALNVGGFKNQVGTYWPADEVWLIKPLLVSQPKLRTEEAVGEVYKIVLIEGKTLWKKLQPLISSAQRPGKHIDSSRLWSLLPDLIQAKMKVVRQDPFEQNGIRATLNLGHSVGHVLEAELGLAHGKAVLLGLAFVLRWQEHETKMSGQFKSPIWIREVQAWPGWPKISELKKSLKFVRHWGPALRRDKKSVGRESIHFVFIEKPGRCFVRKTKVATIESEIERQIYD